MRILLSILLIVLFVPCYSGEAHRDVFTSRPQLRATPVPLSTADPTLKRTGALTYLGGVHLTDPDPAFGGFSSLYVQADRFTLLSDFGTLLRFRMGADWRPTDVRFSELPGGPGTGWTKIDRDSESMVRDPGTGDFRVGFEQHNAIWRYDAGFEHVRGHAEPAAMRDWPENGGPEAMADLPDGRFVVFSETGNWPHHKGHAAICFAGDPIKAPDQGFRFIYMPPAGGYNPSDALALADGRVLVLNRSFSLRKGFRAKLTLIPAGAIRPGATVRGRELATLAAPLIHDNFEGIALTHESAGTILWIVSDDNQSWFERTLLLKFRIDLPPVKAAAN
ncbi:esterase-like activity of phytase family protein [Stakelama sediminis]|uniref:Phytase-like domain-containing protein n=1 Tax=Stakelama sediminis TaxID=463200 RepID=A0A840YVY8_9SPHN|nr:esterase-like activity of phytase family protein [Stakelama sediminis]MBB5717803.1 hypothetical protein [Stakelama sediminis]